MLIFLWIAILSTDTHTRCGCSNVSIKQTNNYITLDESRNVLIAIKEIRKHTSVVNGGTCLRGIPLAVLEASLNDLDYILLIWFLMNL